MKAFGLILVILGAAAFLFGVLLLLAEKRPEGITALVLAAVLVAGGAMSIDSAERKAEKVPLLTDSRGNTYGTRVVTITNHFHDTYYSVPDLNPSSSGSTGKLKSERRASN